MPNLLILGGARSGKSRRALRLAEQVDPARVFIATAEALDDEMAARIARHKDERGDGWQTVEEPLDLASTILRCGSPDAVCVVDCLTLWLSNLFHHHRDVERETKSLCQALLQSPGTVILVSNEIGLGLVPETPLGRDFRDAQGRLNQRVAEVCEMVEFVAAGLPITMKSEK